MHEIIKVSLDNEMDLILAHKRTMKLAEFCGLSMASQTTFATAVSEIARCAISIGKKSRLVLSIHTIKPNRRSIVASIFDAVDLSKANSEAFLYASRLMGDLQTFTHADFFETRLTHIIAFSGLITEAKLTAFKDYFNNEPPISPYDEIRKKNIQLIDLANKLQESEKQYRLLTDTLPLMMFMINARGEISYSNKWLKDFFTTSAGQVTSTSWQSMVHPEDYKNIWKEWDKSQLNKTIFRAQGRLKDSSENYLWHLISILPVRNEKDNVNSWIGFFVDIHSQKLVEETLKDNQQLKMVQEELKKYQLKLEKKITELNISNENLEQFAYIASHDLQEPLRKIKTFSYLINENVELPQKEKNYFDKIVSSADRMSILISDVLSFSRLSDIEAKPEETDLNHLMEKVLVDYELQVQEKNAKITVENLPGLHVIPLQITQLFTNLLNNALKFSKGTPVIKIWAHQVEGKDLDKKATAPLYWCLVFEDNGIGFDQAFAEKIFTIFQRLGNDKSYPGTGIGLALCKKIVENHHGFISATGKKDQGAVFRVYLPVE